MFCTIGDFNVTDGTIAGGFALTDLRIRMQRIADVVVLVPQVLTSGTLGIGLCYKIILYEAGDNFTNVGGSNVSGDVFMATGTTPASWDNKSRLIEIAPAVLDRNKRRADITFTVSRVHSSIKDCEIYILDHDEAIPRTGDAQLIVSVSGITTTNPYALIINGALISHELIQQTGKYTKHAYHIIGAPLFSVTPGVDKMLLETGDFILLETGDKILLE